MKVIRKAAVVLSGDVMLARRHVRPSEVFGTELPNGELGSEPESSTLAVEVSRKYAVMGEDVAAGMDTVTEGPQDEVARADAYESSRREGYVAGLEAAQEEMATVIGRFRDLAETYSARNEELLGVMSDRMGELVIEAIVRVVGEQSRSVAGIEGIVATAVSDVCKTTTVTSIRFSSDDLSLLIAEAPALLEAWSAKGIQVAEDPRVQLGGCILETGRGSVDARIETQLERLREALVEAREHPA